MEEGGDKGGELVPLTEVELAAGRSQSNGHAPGAVNGQEYNGRGPSASARNKDVLSSV